MITGKGSGHHNKVYIAFFGNSPGLQGAFTDYPAAEFLQSRLHDMDLSVVDGFHYVRIDVHTNYFNAVIGRYNGCGKADIAQTHKTCFHIFKLLAVMRENFSRLTPPDELHPADSFSQWYKNTIKNHIMPF